MSKRTPERHLLVVSLDGLAAEDRELRGGAAPSRPPAAGGGVRRADARHLPHPDLSPARHGGHRRPAARPRHLRQHPLPARAGAAGLALVPPRHPPAHPLRPRRGGRPADGPLPLAHRRRGGRALAGPRDRGPRPGRLLRAGTPAFLLGSLLRHGRLLRGLDRGPLDDFVAAEAACLIRTRRPHLLLLHLLDFDHTRHAHGASSPRAMAALREEDGRLGRAAAGPGGGRPPGADHGGRARRPRPRRRGPGGAPQRPLPPRGAGGGGRPRIRRGEPAGAWLAWANTCEGSAQVRLRDRGDAALRRRVGELLAALARDGGAGVQGVIGREEALAQGVGDLDFVVEARRGFAFMPASSGEPVQAGGPHRAAHGYHPDSGHYHSFFLLEGRGVRPGGEVETSRIDGRRADPGRPAGPAPAGRTEAGNRRGGCWPSCCAEEGTSMVENGIGEREYRRRIRAWTLYDWANSAFATTILAAVLPIYYSQVAAATPGQPGPGHGLVERGPQRLAAPGGDPAPPCWAPSRTSCAARSRSWPCSRAWAWWPRAAGAGAEGRLGAGLAAVRLRAGRLLRLHTPSTTRCCPTWPAWRTRTASPPWATPWATWAAGCCWRSTW